MTKKPPRAQPDRKTPPETGPSRREIQTLLAGASALWDHLLESAALGDPKVRIVWGHYSTVGWRCVIKRAKKNLAYLAPRDGSFLVSVALSDEALGEPNSAGLPPDFLESVRASPKVPEGRAARVEVRTARDLQLAAAVLALKART